MLGELEKEVKTQNITEIAINCFFFPSVYLLGWSQKLPETWNYTKIDKRSSQRGPLFLVCKEGKEGLAPLGQGE